MTPIGHKIGLISDERYQKLLDKEEKIQEEINRINSTVIAPCDELNEILVSRGTSAIKSGARLSELIKRPQLNYDILKPFDKNRPDLSRDIFEQAEISTKYDGYIKRQLSQVAEMRRIESKKLDFIKDYSEIQGLRLEAQEKLNKIQPENIGQASRISGVSPADVSVLIIYLSKMEKEK